MRIKEISVIIILIIIMFGISKTNLLCQIESSFSVDLWINEGEINKHSDYTSKIKFFKPREDSCYFDLISDYLDTLCSNNIESYEMLLWVQSDTLFTCFQDSYLEDNFNNIRPLSKGLIGVYKWLDKKWIFIYDRSSGNQLVRNYIEKEFEDLDSVSLNIRYNINSETVYEANYDERFGLYGKYVDSMFYPIVFIPTSKRFYDYLKAKEKRRIEAEKGNIEN